MISIGRLSIFLFIGFSTVQSYVLVQVRKDVNKSNVDALIHKVVPAAKFQEIAETAQKQFKNFKQFTIKNKPDDKELESIVFAIKTNEGNGGRHSDRRSGGNQVDIRDAISKILSYFKAPGKSYMPYYKETLRKYNINPEVITFRNNEKPSMMYEIDSKSIIQSVKSTINTKQFKNILDKVINNAAVIYRAIKEEISNN